MTAAAVGIPASLRPDYAVCRRLAAGHYENFTVVSAVVPAALRPHFAALYAYCRGVDDLGDEAAGDRLALLAGWERELRACYGGAESGQAVFRALRWTIACHRLPAEPFLALIAANRQDQRRAAYASMDELLGYCALSANPVGQLVLRLFGRPEPECRDLSDATCTALQLANFWQDVGRDLDKGRLYVPLDWLRAEGIAAGELRRRPVGDPRLQRVMRRLVVYTAALFARGARLEAMVSWPLRVQLRMYRLGGEAVLAALGRQRYDPFVRRPVLTGGDKLRLGLQALVGAAAPTSDRGGERP